MLRAELLTTLRVKFLQVVTYPEWYLDSVETGNPFPLVDMDVFFAALSVVLNIHIRIEYVIETHIDRVNHGTSSLQMQFQHDQLVFIDFSCDGKQEPENIALHGVVFSEPHHACGVLRNLHLIHDDLVTTVAE
jgi:hypothetical protein